MNGVNLKLSSGTLKVCGTDGLCMCVMTLPVDSNEEFNIILPPKAMNLILKTFTKDEELTFAFNDKLIQISNDEVSLVTRLISEDFPKYEVFIPKKDELDKSIILKQNQLYSSLGRLNSILDKSDQYQLIRINFSKEGLKIYTEDGEESFASDYPYEELETGFNLTYMMKCVSQLSDNLKISFSQKNKGFVFEQEGVEDIFYICMPIKL
jgi:DNA polymerase-3 subunit beta